MKKGIHPEYKETTITCGCGEVIETRSTAENITIEICSKCHPFYTGKQKFVDTAGRVEKFQRRYAWSEDSAKDKAATLRRKKQLPAAPAGGRPGAEEATPEEAPPSPETPSEQ